MKPLSHYILVGIRDHKLRILNTIFIIFLFYLLVNIIIELHNFQLKAKILAKSARFFPQITQQDFKTAIEKAIVSSKVVVNNQKIDSKIQDDFTTTEYQLDLQSDYFKLINFIKKLDESNVVNKMQVLNFKKNATNLDIFLKFQNISFTPKKSRE